MKKYMADHVEQIRKVLDEISNVNDENEEEASAYYFFHVGCLYGITSKLSEEVFKHEKFGSEF